MKKIALFTLAAALFGGTAFADPYTITFNVVNKSSQRDLTITAKVPLIGQCTSYDTYMVCKTDDNGDFFGGGGILFGTAGRQGPSISINGSPGFSIQINDKGVGGMNASLSSNTWPVKPTSQITVTVTDAPKK